MRTIYCQVLEHEDYGILGLVPEIYMNWFKYANFTPSINLGHEMMAHGNNETGSLEDELKALGAELWLSDFFSYLQFSLDNAWLFASSLNNSIADALLADNYSVSAPIKKYSLSAELKAKIKALFDAAIPRLVAYLRDTLENDAQNYADSNYTPILEWLCYGFSHARKRYCGHDPWDLWLLRQRIDAATKHIMFEENCRYRLTYSLTRHFVELKELTYADIEW